MSAKRDGDDVVGTPGTEGAGVGDDGGPVTGSGKTEPAQPAKGGNAAADDQSGEERAASAELTPSDPDDD